MFRVLIVDDEMLVRTNLKMMLDWEKNGFTIYGEASSGVEALKLIEKLQPDIILSDVKMPGMDGLQLSMEVNQKYRKIKMIMLSNYDDFDLVKGTLQNGALDYILKHSLMLSISLNETVINI